MKDLTVAGQMFRHAEANSDKRTAVQFWLTAVVQAGMAKGEDVAPGLHLLQALEGLAFGHSDPLFALPDGMKAGGQQLPPAEIGRRAFAVAAVDALIETKMSVSAAVALVAADLIISESALLNYRKKAAAARGRNGGNPVDVEVAKASDEELASLRRLMRPSGIERSAEQRRISVYMALARVSGAFGLDADPL
ncbi:MAG: hypothetical protein LCH46_07215 [Proteobacteria bacterium]|nr:hypothetical protein [Pseudomonadota bacterium]